MSDNYKRYMENQFSRLGWVTEGFDDAYNKLYGHEMVLRNAAIFFIIKNYKYIDDWGNLEIKPINRNNVKVEFHNHIKCTRRTDNKRLKNLFVKMDAESKAKHNPIVTLTDPILDTSDGDFSVIINGEVFLMLETHIIFEIVLFMEHRLNARKNK